MGEWFKLIFINAFVFSSSLDFFSDERTNAMSDIIIGLDCAEKEILTYEVSDEALETVAGSENVSGMTFWCCTGLNFCRGWQPVYWFST